MTAFVDVTYRGLRVAHKAKLVAQDSGAFLEHEQPLPVGSPLEVLEEGQATRAARVVHVVEHEAGAGPAGMRIAWGAATAAAAAAAPVAAAEPEPVAATPSEPSSSGEFDAVESSGVSADASIDSSDDSSDRSSDGVPTPAANGGSGKKSKKNKKRR